MCSVNDDGPSVSQPISILLVDDEPAVLESLSRALRSDQYEIHTAPTGMLALSQMELKRVDVVIADIHMPGMLGTDLLARVAERWPDISRIALTGSANISDAVKLINNGGLFHWISKPWDIDELRAKVQEAAEHARKLQSARRRLQNTAYRPSQGPENLPHVVKHFYKGELVFKAGSPGHHIHFIRAGKVELSIEQNGNRIVVDTCKAGDCFGAIAPILNGTRTLSATAVDFTETFSITQATINALFVKNDPIFLSLTQALAVQARRAFVTLANSDAMVSPIDRAAHALDLMARAEAPQPSKGSAKRSGKGKASDVPAKLQLADVVQTLNAVTGIVKSHAPALLAQMAQLNLIVMEAGRYVYVKPGEIAAMAEKIGARHGDALFESMRSETELMTLDELAETIGVDRAIIQRKMAQGDLPDDLWSFRKTETLRIINEKGREFFRKLKPKKVEDFDSIEDIFFLDRDTLWRAVKDMDVYKLGTLLQPQQEPVRERVLGAISNRLKPMVLEAMSEMDSVDEIEVGLLEVELIDRIKAAKLAKDEHGSN